MKKRIIGILLFLGLWWSGATASTIPAGQTLYLYVSSPSWLCYASYVLYSSHWQAYELMTPVDGVPGLYQFTFTSSFNHRIYFGATSQVLTGGAHEWIGFCDVKTKELDFSWTASNPCYLIDDVTGSGHWGAIPEGTSGAFDVEIDSVTYEIN